MDALGLHIEGPLPALPLLPDEAGVEHDRREVVLAGHRVLHRGAQRLADAGDLEAAVHPVVVQLHLGPHDPGDFEGGAEDRPRQAPELAGEDLGEGTELLVGDRRRHDEDRLAVTIVDRLRPAEDGDGGDVGQVEVAAAALTDVGGDRRLARAVR